MPNYSQIPCSEVFVILYGNINCVRLDFDKFVTIHL